MSWFTVFLIVALIALVLVVLFFFMTGRSFNDVISPFIGGSNVDAVRNACGVACASQSVSSFCDDKKTVKFGEEKETLDEIGKVTEATSATATCDDFSKNEGYNVSVEQCPGLCP